MWIEKNSLNSFICHLSFLKKLSPTHTHPAISVCEFSKPYGLIIFWVWVIHKRLNVNWKKIQSIILSVTCHSLRNFPPLITSPHVHSWIFKTLQVIISWIWVIHKRLNVNWEEIHSIIISLTCHSLRNFPSVIHIPDIHLWIFKTLWVIISWVWVICKMLKSELHRNSLNTFICHLSFRC